MSAFWILQTNAARLDVDAYLNGRATAVWGCGRFGERIEVGDRAFLWRAAGGTKAMAGIIGVATVIEPAQMRAHDAAELCRDERLPRPKLRVLLRLDEVRTDDPVPRNVVKGHPAMRTHPVVTVNQGAAFSLSEEQAAALRELWEG